jgi:LCP family protein required for cell wall assembly
MSTRSLPPNTSGHPRAQLEALAGCSLRGLLMGSVLLGLTLGSLNAGLRSDRRGAGASPPAISAAATGAAASATARAGPPATVTLAAVTPPSPAPSDTASPPPPPTHTPTPSLTPSQTLTPSATPPAQTPRPPVLWDTPTPFETMAVTVTVTGTLATGTVVTGTLATGTPTPGTPTPVTPIPTAVSPFTLQEGAVNILLLGSDRRPNDGAWRTDTMIIVAVDPQSGAVSMLSIPRDLFIYIPHYGMGRINTVDRRGGPELVRQVLLYNLGIPVHYYARVDFDNFKRIIDAVGGIDVAVDCQLHDWRLISPELDPALSESWAVYTQTVGIQHMDGDLALWYARSRMSTNDFDRGRRQQKILRALYRTAREQQLLTRVPELWGAFQDSVETDLGIGDLLWLAGFGLQTGDNLRVRSFYLGGGVISWLAPPDNAQVLLPDWPRIEPIVRGFLAPPAMNRGAQDQIFVDIWNGTTRYGADRLAAERLATEGFFPSIGAPDRTDYANTIIVDFTGATKGSKVPRLREIFGVPAERVVVQIDPNSPAQYRVILGADYDSCRGARSNSSYVAPTRTPTPTGTLPTLTPSSTPTPSGTPAATATSTPPAPQTPAP